MGHYKQARTLLLTCLEWAPASLFYSLTFPGVVLSITLRLGHHHGSIFTYLKMKWATEGKGFLLIAVICAVSYCSRDLRHMAMPPCSAHRMLCELLQAGGELYLGKEGECWTAMAVNLRVPFSLSPILSFSFYLD